MKLQLNRKHALCVAERFPELKVLLDQLKLGSRAELSFEQLDRAHWGFIAALYEAEGPAMAGRAAQLRTLETVLASTGHRYEEGELERLVIDITNYMIEGGVRGWVFSLDRAGKPLAYLLQRIDFSPPGEEEAGRLILELRANAMGKIATVNVTLRERDIVGHHIAEILAAKGYVKETLALLEAYDRSAAAFFEWRSESGRQFSAQGVGIYAEDPTASHRNTDWSRKKHVVLSTSGDAARLVNDESILQQRALTLDAPGNLLSKYLRKAERSDNYSPEVERSIEQAHIPENMFVELPVHGYILMFHLELHHHLWVHVDDMRPYRYKSDLRDKLILPAEQTDLIDILTSEMEVLMDDIIEGKSGGTTVLCVGPPGVGKTLTAEVYSEIIKRPLYRVHSGQLGLSVSEMEKCLKETLTRAQRWGAVMLIDEADVYIKRRDDNISANAVVGVFLRVLEYFNGLLFLTTNRVGDIDEAIVSRCIAMIQYRPPDAADRYKIWEMMAQQFGLDIEPKLLQALPELFPQACGRDIKGLAKLVAKYCGHKSEAPTLEVFQRCSIFRGLKYVPRRAGDAPASRPLASAEPVTHELAHPKAPTTLPAGA